MTRRLLALPVLAVSLLASGCGLLGGGRSDTPPTEPGPTEPAGPVTILLTGNPDMNAGGNAARVYLYPLASEATFLTTPVQVFWEDPAAALGADLVGTVRDVTVRPSDATFLEEVGVDNAAFLGIAVDLRAPEGTTWRAAVPTASVRGRTLRVTVTDGGLVLAGP